MATVKLLASLQTPSLVVDERRMQGNIRRLQVHLDKLRVASRPHLKTAKSVDIARQMLSDGYGAATVSTLKEAEIFAAAGIGDILYAVGITPQKLSRVLEIRATGCDLMVVLDSLDQAKAVCAASRQGGDTIPVLIEIDSDGHRSGLSPNDPMLVDVGRVLIDGGAALRGVMTHAGESYKALGRQALAAFAEQERLAAVTAANPLRVASLPCPIVSVGATPTAHFARDLSGITEVRAGVYVFFDLVMAGIGVCSIEDIALSVLTTVIGHQRHRGWTIVDAGWMAMSSDRGTAKQAVDQGYGVVCDIEGNVLDDLIMISASQEHGILALRPGSSASFPELPIGTVLRILPNHACATASQFGEYQVIAADSRAGLIQWPRFQGW